MSYKAKVISILGAPGVGKSTFATKLFSEMKIKQLNVELCTEFIKDKIWEENKMALSNQLYIFTSQYFKLCCVADKADFVISDGPLITEPLYNNYSEPMKSHLNQLVEDCESQFNNYYYFIRPSFNEYKTFGRLHTKKESDEKDSMLKEFLNNKKIQYKEITDKSGIDVILSDLA